jgi:hypothetical protein
LVTERRKQNLTTDKAFRVFSERFAKSRASPFAGNFDLGYFTFSRDGQR